jgi:phospholipid/cholesterol/gamma-HCH transport system permease protein
MLTLVKPQTKATFKRMHMPQNTYIKFDPDCKILVCSGDWKIQHVESILVQIDKLSFPRVNQCEINLAEVKSLDSAGALALRYLVEKKTAIQFTFQHGTDTQFKLIKLIHSQKKLPQTKPNTHRFLYRVGQSACAKWSAFTEYLAMIGELSTELVATLFSPQRLRFSSIIAVIYSTGFQALGIIALLSFMIGIVMTYQMGFQLKAYGANIFIVNLLGVSILREFAPLITAIMVAGRSGSAFTAQLGTMKITQEIDALATLGLKPLQYLVLPRVLGLFIALPLLTMWANIFGILGGICMSNTMLNIGPNDFLYRFQEVVSQRTFIIGLCKTPIFALIISTIGCYQGMKVRGSADSIGKQTTKSVVLSIFFIIIADALFSILFSKFHL